MACGPVRRIQIELGYPVDKPPIRIVARAIDLDLVRPRVPGTADHGDAGALGTAGVGVCE